MDKKLCSYDFVKQCKAKCNLVKIKVIVRSYSKGRKGESFPHDGSFMDEKLESKAKTYYN